MTGSNTSGYRRDIDGLRAIAVLSVVGFHAAPGRIAGGFIGVDIFFVISGFLISTIILGTLEKGRFSFLNFYERRIKRIFPALLCVLAMCFAFGSVLLTAEQYAELGKQIAGGAGFYANFLLWMESGYFDSASSMKPLLHLWSLSIEEQFYIVWPLLLWLLARYRVHMLGALVVITLSSFALNILTVADNPIAAFYSPLTRFWELLAGAILAWLVLHGTANLSDLLYRYRNTLSISGAILCVSGLALIDEHRRFPGWWAALPVLGTALLLAATEHAWINRMVLSNRVLVWFGLISYPLYLTHWPILSFLRILEDGEVPQLIRVYAVLAAIGLSWFIYHFIETPIRSGGRHWSKPVILVCAMSAIWLAGFYIHQHDGMALRTGTVPLAVNSGEIGHRPFFEYMDEHFYPCKPADIRSGAAEWKEFRRCYQSRDSDKNDVALLGDSHAEHLFIGLAEQLKERDVVYYASSGAPLLGNTEFQDVFNFLSTDTNIRVVFVAANWGQALAGLNRHEQQAELDHLVEFLTSTGRKVYLVGDVPTFQFSPSKCKYAHRIGQDNICRQAKVSAMLESEHYYPLLSAVAEKHPGVAVIHPETFFCDDDHCSMSSAGVMHYRDKNHLNVDGSKDLWRYVMRNTKLRDDINKRFSH